MAETVRYRFSADELGSSRWLAALGGVSGKIGTPAFPAAFLGLVNRFAPTTHCSVFSYGYNGVEHIFSDGPVASTTADDLAKDYISRYFRRDPLYRLLGSTRAGFPSENVQHLNVKEGYDREYREHFFSRTGLIDKISMRGGDDSRTLICNLYRTERQGLFNEDERCLVQTVAPLLSSLIGAHANVPRLGSPLVGKGSVRSFVHEALGSDRPLFARLTQRERAVCERILLGFTSEAIALDLNIAVSSVLTYRRRAYERLQISSQHDLFALCLESLGLS